MIHFYEMMSNISLLALAPIATLGEVVATDRTPITSCSPKQSNLAFVKEKISLDPLSPWQQFPLPFKI